MQNRNTHILLFSNYLPFGDETISSATVLHILTVYWQECSLYALAFELSPFEVNLEICLTRMPFICFIFEFSPFEVNN